MEARYVITAVTWCGYASAYFLRKPFSVIKADIIEERGFTKSQCGMVDTAFYITYALGGLMFASYVDKLGTRATLGFGLIASGCCTVFFGQFDSIYVWMLMMACLGAAQALLWPSAVKAVSNQWSKDTLSYLLGWWASCCSAGSLIGSALAVYVAGVYGWRSAFFFASLVVMAIGGLQLVFLPRHDLPFTEGGPDEEVGEQVASKAPSRTLSLQGALTTVPNMFNVSMSFFVFKLVRYGLLLWLPIFYTQRLGYQRASATAMSSLFDIGGMAGPLLSGAIVQKVANGSAPRAAFLSFAGVIGALVAVVIAGSWSVSLNSAIMFFAGGCIGALDILVSGTLALQVSRGAGPDVEGSIVAMVNGCGSVGVVFQGLLIGFVADLFGWDAVIWLIIVLLALAAMFVLRVPAEGQR